jgi:hypothetical protein
VTRGSREARPEPGADALEAAVDRDDGAPHARAQPRTRAGEPARARGDPRRPLLHLELQHPRGRVDGGDPLRREDARAVQARAQDESVGAAAHGIDVDAANDADPRPARADDESLRPREPVLEDVAPPLEHVLPHRVPLRAGRSRQTR